MCPVRKERKGKGKKSEAKGSRKKEDAEVYIRCSTGGTSRIAKSDGQVT